LQGPKGRVIRFILSASSVTCGCTMLPPAESEYAVEPVADEIIILTRI